MCLESEGRSMQARKESQDKGLKEQSKLSTDCSDQHQVNMQESKGRYSQQDAGIELRISRSDPDNSKFFELLDQYFPEKKTYDGYHSTIGKFFPIKSYYDAYRFDKKINKLLDSEERAKIKLSFKGTIRILSMNPRKLYVVLDVIENQLLRGLGDDVFNVAKAMNIKMGLSKKVMEKFHVTFANFLRSSDFKTDENIDEPINDNLFFLIKKGIFASEKDCQKYVDNIKRFGEEMGKLRAECLVKIEVSNKYYDPGNLPFSYNGDSGKVKPSDKTKKGKHKFGVMLVNVKVDPVNQNFSDIVNGLSMSSKSRGWPKIKENRKTFILEPFIVNHLDSFNPLVEKMKPFIKSSVKLSTSSARVIFYPVSDRIHVALEMKINTELQQLFQEFAKCAKSLNYGEIADYANDVLKLGIIHIDFIKIMKNISDKPEGLISALPINNLDEYVKAEDVIDKKFLNDPKSSISNFVTELLKFGENVKNTNPEITVLFKMGRESQLLIQ